MAPWKSTFQRLYQAMRNTRIVRLEKDKEHWIFNQKNYGPFLYQGENGWKPLSYPGLCEKILAKSQTVAGFFLIQYAYLFQEHLDRLFVLYAAGKILLAAEHLHSGKSVSKLAAVFRMSCSPSYVVLSMRPHMQSE